MAVLIGFHLQAGVWAWASSARWVHVGVCTAFAVLCLVGVRLNNPTSDCSLLPRAHISQKKDIALTCSEREMRGRPGGRRGRPPGGWVLSHRGE